MKLWRLFLALLAIGSIAWVFYQYTGASGYLTLHYQFNTTQGAISEFSPHGRALDLEKNQNNGETYQRLVGEPAYFTAKLPSAFERVRVTLEYQNPNQSVIELGLKRTLDPLIWDYQMQPLENKFVDDTTWPTLTEGDYQLAQREPSYTSVNDFFTNPPLNQHVGTYLFDPETLPFIDASYQASDANVDLNYAIQGKYDVYLYLANEDLKFATEYIGDGDVSIELWHRGNLMETRAYSNTQEAALQVSNLEPGVYHLVIQATDDITFSRITSAQERLVFGKSLKLVGDIAVELRTPADAVTLVPMNSKGVQTVQAIDGDLALQRVNGPVTWTNPLPWQTVSLNLPQSNVWVIADSYISLAGALPFDPWFGFKTVNQYTRPETLNYVVSKQYTAPERTRGWTTATAEFDLYGVTQGQPNTLQFILSAPGLGETPEGLKVRSITVEAIQQPVTIPTLWNKLFNK